MGSEEGRRFSDREVALVLKRASEIERADPPEGARGLSLGDLEEIAREVGISPEALARAVQSVAVRRGPPGSLAGAPLVRRAIRVVGGELDQEAKARLIRVVDEGAQGAGSVTEALGSVRWTSAERFRSTQVSLTPEGGETVVQVVEKAAPHLRPLCHLIPAGWGGILALGFLAPLAGPGAALVGASLVLAGTVAGGAAGRLYWSWLSERSRQRVDRLAAALAEAAEQGRPGA